MRLLKMEKDFIVVKGAKEHNLKNINLKIPRNSLVIITGLSGSGKSSLAFDTLYAEGQRRYVESLSAYARQFLEQLQKPDVEYIGGLSPAISIERRTAGVSPRSTVGTQTEIYDYLRLLFAKVGKPHCYSCGRQISRQTAEMIVEKILTLPKKMNIQLLAPLVRGRKGEHQNVLKDIRKTGFVRVRIDGRIYDLAQKIELDKKKKHNIEAVVDRLVINSSVKTRLTDSVETALKIGKGMILVHSVRGKASNEDILPSPEISNRGYSSPPSVKKSKYEIRNAKYAEKELLFSELYACPDCGISYAEQSPRVFSFNSPYGACPSCNGLGTKMEFDSDLVIPDRDKSIRQGVITPWRRGGHGYILYYRSLIFALADHYNFSLDTPFKNLSKKIRQIILYGNKERIQGKRFEGIIPHLERLFRETDSDYLKSEISRFMSVLPCPTCCGGRLKKESLSFTINGKSIWDISRMSIKEVKQFFNNLRLSSSENTIAYQILKVIKERINYCIDVGLDYLALDRKSGTLSGGEAQRIRLATQVGAGLVGVIYILDEPSIGLHQRDNRKLLLTLKALRDLGNTVIVVEHDESTIRAGDYIIDLGPGAGAHGGEVVVSGSLKELLNCKDSITGKYLRRELQIPVPRKRKTAVKDKFIEIKGAREHNLKNINVRIPLGLFVCVSGVSGSGKSTLVNEILYRALAQKFYHSKLKPGEHEKIVGSELIDKVIVVDQSPIGRTPRSNPATYTGIFTYIRELFSKIPASRMRGYKPGRFSFNVKGGRCEACFGDGIKRIEMHFLPDVYVRCEVCKGKRFNEQTLEIRYKGNSIADILSMSVEGAIGLFENIPHIKHKLKTISDVGLGYIELGQPATTLSGGEAQRIKLATELSKRSKGHVFYLLDEPTTGLHFADIDKLLNVLHALVDAGNSVLVIEHNLDVIKCADYIIDLGPEGGDEGGRIVVCGKPEEVIKEKASYTGRYLKRVLQLKQRQKKREEKE